MKRSQNRNGNLAIRSLELRFRGGREGSPMLFLEYCPKGELEMEIDLRYAFVLLILIRAQEADVQEPRTLARAWVSIEEVVARLWKLRGAPVEEDTIVKYVSNIRKRVRIVVRSELSSRHAALDFIQTRRKIGYRIPPGIEVRVTGW